MAKKPTLTDLKKELRKKTQYELVEEIANLYKKFSNVKEFYQASFFSDDAAVLKKYKQIVENEFIPNERSQFPKMRASVARKAISDYKKISCSNLGIADIMLTYVEAGVYCTSKFGDIDEPFYNSMESMYESALSYMVKEGLFHEFGERAKAVVTNTSDCGWGFHDQLTDLYYTYRDEAE